MSPMAWIVLLLWALQFLGHVVFSSFFSPISSTTWLLVLVFCFWFCTGDIVAKAFAGKLPKNTKTGSAPSRNTRALINLAFVLLVGLLLFNTWFFYQTIMATLGGLNFSRIRLLIVNDFTTERQFSRIVSLYGAVVAATIYLLAYTIKNPAPRFHRFKTMMLLLLGTAAAVLTTGRLYLLLFFLSAIAIGLLYRVLKRQYLLLLGGAFVVLFFSLALVFGKGNSDSLLEGLVWNVQVYGFSSIGCLNNFIETNTQATAGGYLVPSPLRPMLRLLGVDLPDKPVLLPFAWIPEQCNTYTLLFPVFHDLGWFGVMVFAFVLGLYHGVLWRWTVARKTVFLVFLTAVSMYPLFMMVFEDAYFSSPGFWFMLIAVAVVLQTLIYMVDQLNKFLGGKSTTVWQPSKGEKV